MTEPTLEVAYQKLIQKLHFWSLDLEEFQRHLRAAIERDPASALRLGPVMGGGLMLTKAIRGFLSLLSDALDAEERRG